MSELFIGFIFVGTVALLYLVETILILRFLIWKLRKRQTPPDFLSRSPVKIVHFFAILGVLCLLYGYFIEPYWIEVKKVTIPTDKFQNTSLKIVQISDLHCDKKIRNEKRLPAMINSLNPDIIVFTGDALNEYQALPVLKETLRSLKAGIGKYAVIGNYDVLLWRDLDLFSDTGFKLLTNDTVELVKQGEKFYISGLDVRYPAGCRKLLKDQKSRQFSIFLHHFPGLIEKVKDLNVDLYLAGHIHGGQVALPFYGALITLARFGKKYESGRYNVGNTVLYVNRGIGMEGGFPLRVRFLARPEITVFDIKPAQRAN